jgi:hypothetical protein
MLEIMQWPQGNAESSPQQNRASKYYTVKPSEMRECQLQQFPQSMQKTGVASVQLFFCSVHVESNTVTPKHYYYLAY